MITDLDTPERVHYAMLEGRLPRITMMMCAHTWGAQTVMDLAKANELRGDIKTASDVLIDYDGDSIWQQAQSAVAKIDWLTNELKISKRNEHAFMQVLEQERKQRRPVDSLPLTGNERAELFALRSKLRYAKIFMEANDPLNARFLFGPTTEEEGHEQTARQTTGLTGKV